MLNTLTSIFIWIHQHFFYGAVNGSTHYLSQTKLINDYWNKQHRRWLDGDGGGCWYLWWYWLRLKTLRTVIIVVLIPYTYHNISVVRSDSDDRLTEAEGLQNVGLVPRGAERRCIQVTGNCHDDGGGGTLSRCATVLYQNLQLWEITNQVWCHSGDEYRFE